MSSDSGKPRLLITARLFPGWFSRLVIVVALCVVIVARLLGRTSDPPWPLHDPAIVNLLTLIFGFVAVATAWIWFVFFSGYSTAAQRWVLGGTVALVLLGMAMFRVVEVTGSMVPTFAVRWGWLAPDHKLGRLAMTPAEPIDLATTTTEDFSQFLGPERSCWVAGPELARDWTKQPPKLVWKQPIGAGWSAFCGGRMVTR